MLFPGRFPPFKISEGLNWTLQTETTLLSQVNSHQYTLHTSESSSQNYTLSFCPSHKQVTLYPSSHLLESDLCATFHKGNICLGISHLDFIISDQRDMQLHFLHHVAAYIIFSAKCFIQGKQFHQLCILLHSRSRASHIHFHDSNEEPLLRLLTWYPLTYPLHFTSLYNIPNS